MTRVGKIGRSASVLLLLLLVWGSAGPLSGFAAGEPPADDPLRALVREAVERNPDLASARFSAEAAGRRILPAGSLPDPMLSLSYSNVPVDDFALDKEPMTSRDIGISQAIPFPGKLSLKEEIARLGAAQAGDMAEMARNLVRFRVERNFFALIENRAEQRLTEKNKAFLGELLAVANSRYSVGKTPQQDLFKVQVEISRMENMLIALRKQEVALLSDLNTLRDRPVDAPVDLPPSYPVPEILSGEEELVGIATSSNPDLKREADAVRQKEKALLLARKQILPDFQVGAAYKFREDSQTGVERPDFFSANVMVSLPLWHARKQDEEVEAAARDLSSRENAYRNAVNAVRNRIREITAGITRWRSSLDLFDSGLLPQARESVNSSLSAYQVGQVEFASVLLGQISLYQQEIDREKAANALGISVAELELVLGKELFTGERTIR
ncbi:MAG TPA: TolC family protein [Candidatus Aquicultoraceae bacterium]|nr:TolC family protein [Candidatus Aquicultoraceae bacterium]